MTYQNGTTHWRHEQARLHMDSVSGHRHFRRPTWFALLLLLVTAFMSWGESLALDESFRHPPDSAKPWTYWFWINGNISKEGITADLEAMARVGIGGVLIMEVARPDMAPPGPVAFGSPRWREMFKHVVAEAGRLGLMVDMNNDAGWCGSGGPWITPEFSMQKLVAAPLTVEGPQRFEGRLPQPKTQHPYYRDIKVLAFPAPAKSASVRKETILDLSARMDAEGKLAWDVPEGTWQVLRIGCSTTGQKNHPAPASGQGLECDKFNPEAIRRQFDAFIGKLVDDVGPRAGKAFGMTHIDSWEVGTQDWTPRMAEEFRRRRGYDLTPWLVVLAGGSPVGSAEETKRFQRDYKRTQAELNDAAYAGALRSLAHRRGLKLSIEAYGPTATFLNPLTYGAEADLPMAEFWITRWHAWHLLSGRLLSSVAHVYGRPIVGAESFTSWPECDPLTEHPYSVKAIGDWAFCEGINKFVFHRSALNPWTNCAPGMTFAGFGWHAEPSQTWWEPGAAFMRYLARCQALLQQGQFVADVCRLVPAGEDHGQKPGMAALPGQYDALPPGYNYDYISDKALLDEVTVKKGRLVTRSGTSYRLLQLPNTRTLTPEIARKLRDLVKAGAMVTGPKPVQSPSLRDYPRCDRQVGMLAAEVWDDCDGATVTEHKLGAGQVFWGRPVSNVLAQAVGSPDLSCVLDPAPTEAALMSVTHGRGFPRGDEPAGVMPTTGLNWIHRRAGQTEIYFLASPQHRSVEALCTFRVQGLQPELWDPASGEMRPCAVFRDTARGTQIPLHFDPAGSMFVIFKHKSDPASGIVEVTHDSALVFGAGQEKPLRLPEIWREGHRTMAVSRAAGSYAVRYANGTRALWPDPGQPTGCALSGPWNVRFQAGRGAPEQTEFTELVDWSKHAEPGIRYFSGTATYGRKFDWNPPGGQQRVWLDLGEVKVMAAVELNGSNLGVLWKPPYAVEVTGKLKAGRNDLVVKITNLWPNRLIGDEQFPDDCTPDARWKTGVIPVWPEWFLKGQPRPEPRRLTLTTWKPYRQNSPLLPSGLLGPVTLRGEPVIVATPAHVK